MAKEKTKRMDWYKWFPRDIQTSRPYQRFSPTQRGAYRDLLDECWINFPNVSCEVDAEWLSSAWSARDGWMLDGCSILEEGLAHICNLHNYQTWKKEMPAVLAKFRIENGRLINDKLLEQVDEALQDTVNASIRGQGNRKSNSQEPVELTTVQLQSDCSPTTGDLELDNKIREDKIREDKIKVGDILSAMEHEDRKIASDLNNGRKKGEPGYFVRGQYPGTSPKAVFAHIARAWSRARGDAAICRYPSKYPESWEMLCDQKSSDLIVPAFELWATREGYNTEWPLSEFIKVAQKYMAEIIPLKADQPKITQSEIDAAYARAKKGHEAIWGSTVEAAVVTESEVQVEPNPASMFEEESK